MFAFYKNPAYIFMLINYLRSPSKIEPPIRTAMSTKVISSISIYHTIQHNKHYSMYE